MSVEEIVAQIRALPAAEQERIRAVLDGPPEPPIAREVQYVDGLEVPAGVTPEVFRRGLEAWKQLEAGLTDHPRTDLSQNIDEAVYGRRP
ncbi:MAG: hypothetical protein IT204_05555 [Fimbriimonadaceae bacterium]|nr:hypothetical protein [Fimbriimonadaceae bacterium]